MCFFFGDLYIYPKGIYIYVYIYVGGLKKEKNLWLFVGNQSWTLLVYL